MTLSDDLAKATSDARALEAALAAATSDDASDQAALDAALAHVAELERQLADCRKPPAAAIPVGISPGANPGDESAWKAMLDGMADTGLTCIRFDVSRAGAEPSKGRYNFDRPVKVCTWAKERGIRPLPCPAYAARWDSPDGSASMFDGPVDLDALEAYGVAYGAALGAVLDDDDDEAEFWNEENTVHFWTLTPSAARYMLCAYRFQRGRLQSNPKARLVLGGVAPAPDKPPGLIAPETFVQGCYDAVGKGELAAVRKRFWHGVGWHPYMGGYPPATVASWSMLGVKWDKLVATIHGKFAGAPTPLVYSTEFGYATEGDKSVTEAKQGQYLIEQIELMRARPDCGPLFIHRWQDFPHGKYPGLTPYNETLGIHKSDGTPKRAVAMLKEYLT